jgi:hypothetical protein
MFHPVKINKLLKLPTVQWIVASNAVGGTPAEVGDNPSMTLKRKSKIHWGTHVDRD